MENKIPLPTDNIYKFYALFGLLLFIFSLGSVLYVSGSTNDVVFAGIIEVEGLKAIEQPTPLELTKRKALERRIEIALDDKDFCVKALGVIATIGIFSMWFGFSKWHQVVQPIQDEVARLQLEKLRREVANLDAVNGNNSKAEAIEEADTLG